MSEHRRFIYKKYDLQGFRRGRLTYAKKGEKGSPLSRKTPHWVQYRREGIEGDEKDYYGCEGDKCVGRGPRRCGPVNDPDERGGGYDGFFGERTDVE